MLRLTLVKMGYDIVEASSGKEAAKLFEREVPDLVLTDLVMPEKDGLEIIREFQRKSPGIKIIAMSGGGRMNTGDYLKIAGMMGAQYLLAKPFSNDEMALALEGLLHKGLN